MKSELRVFEILKSAEMKWWEHFLLLFKPKHYSTDGLGTVVEYKCLFGRLYVLRDFQVPPQHPNCRCVLAGNKIESGR